MTIRDALIKLCACATGGALFGGGAMHIGTLPAPKKTHVTARAQPQSVAPRIRVASASKGRGQHVVRRIRRVHTKRVTTITYPPQAIQIAAFVPPAGPVASTPAVAATAERSGHDRGSGYFGGGYFGGWSGGGGGSIVMVSANASASSTASSTASASATASSSSNVTTPPPPRPGGPGEHPPPPPDHVDVPAPPISWIFGLTSLGLVFGRDRRRARAVLPSVSPS